MKTLYHFFRLWGTDCYGERIDAGFAWELAKVFAEHDEEFKKWYSLKG